MNYNNLIEEAKTTNCAKTLHKLAGSVDSTVRRAVARNMHTLGKTIDLLAFDPVLNVSYMAVQHPNCSSKRIFLDTSNPCVTCEKDERKIPCANCLNLTKYYNKF